MNRIKVVVFTGAGISAESGLQTFRGSDGLWEGYRLEDITYPDGFARNPALVQHFYNERREASVVRLFLIRIISRSWSLGNIMMLLHYAENIDDLHERAGSKNVLHLHGEILKAQSSLYLDVVYDLGSGNIDLGALYPYGSLLRAHVVWFGESVPQMLSASELTKEADWFIIIGTSLQVYPAANLLEDTKPRCIHYLIDPNASRMK